MLYKNKIYFANMLKGQKKNTKPNMNQIAEKVRKTR